MSETTTEAPPQQGEQPPAKPPTLDELLSDLDDDKRKVILGEVTKARSEAKGLRERLKPAEAAKTELEQLKAAQQTSEERAAAAAKAAQDRALATIQKAARTTVKTALVGVVDDPDLILEDLNLSRFVTDDGEIDEDAVTALRNKYAALGGGTGSRKPRPDPSQASGANGSTTANPGQEFASFLQGALRK